MGLDMYLELFGVDQRVVISVLAWSHGMSGHSGYSRFGGDDDEEEDLNDEGEPTKEKRKRSPNSI